MSYIEDKRRELDTQRIEIFLPRTFKTPSRINTHYIGGTYPHEHRCYVSEDNQFVIVRFVRTDDDGIEVCRLRPEVFMGLRDLLTAK